MNNLIKKTRFFEIEMSLLGSEERVFPFTLFIYEPNSQRHAVFLYEKSPYHREIQEKLGQLLSKDYKLALSIAEKDKVLTYLKLAENDFPQLVKDKNEWELLHEEHLAKYTGEVLTEFSFIDHFRTAIETDNFQLIIARARAEISLFSYSISPTVSNAINIAERILKADDQTSRIIACCYFFAKKMNYRDEESLAALVCAAAFRDLGSTQLHKSLFNKLAHLNDDERHEWEKHPALSVFLLKKGNIELSERVYRLILEHHERYDGSGFPRQKKAEFLEPMSELIGFFEHLFDYAYGKITGRKNDLSKTIRAILLQLNQEGLSLNFSPSLLVLIESHLAHIR